MMKRGMHGSALFLAVELFSMDENFIGVYALPERDIRIDSNTPRDDLMLVIRRLISDLQWYQTQLSNRPVIIRSTPSPEPNPKRGSPPFPEVEAAGGGGNSPDVSNAHSAAEGQS
jgi:hypothetical protein